MTNRSKFSITKHEARLLRSWRRLAFKFLP